MAKRSAGSYLTDQNWEEEDEQEEAGEFTKAAEDVISKREIRKAKRRGAVTTGDSNVSGTGGVFKGFAGFTSKPSSSTPAFGAFGGVSNGKTESIKPAGSTTTTTTTTTTSGEPADKPVVNGTASKSKSRYLAQLKALNVSVARWIKEHVDKNPYCLLTPIFTDYGKHLGEIERKFPRDKKDDEEKDGEKETEATSKQGSSSDSEKCEKETASSSSPAAPTFSFQSSLAPSTGGTSATPTTTTTTSIFGGSSLGGGGFKFGETKPATEAPTSKPGFSFGTSSSGSAPGTGIFGGGSSLGTTGLGTFAATGTGGFSFASSKPAGGGSDTKGEEVEEYVPPKPDVVEVKEEGAFFTKRCKLYFKKGDAWQEKGVGNLHLKPCSGKTQLLIRADTSLGNILLNIMLTSSLPMGRQGKNNVTLMCVPNPPVEGDTKTPVSMLVRVKTAEDADELLSKMKDGDAS